MCSLIRLAGGSFGIYAVDATMVCLIWFVIGMMLAENMIRIMSLPVSIIMFIGFIIGSIVVQTEGISFVGDSLVLGIMACYSITSIVFRLFSGEDQNKYCGYLAQYTMPLFLMHTLFAAPLRSILMKLGITNCVLHISLGIVISFCGPIIAMKVMERFRLLDFLVYPSRYIHIY
jgi:hypothetical protein